MAITPSTLFANEFVLVRRLRRCKYEDDHPLDTALGGLRDG